MQWIKYPKTIHLEKLEKKEDSCKSYKHFIQRCQQDYMEEHQGAKFTIKEIINLIEKYELIEVKYKEIETPVGIKRIPVGF